MDHYTDQKVFIPCVVKVEWNGDRETGPTKFSYKIKFKGAVEGFNVIDVKSPRSVTKGTIIRESVDSLCRDGTDMRGDAQNPKSFQAPRM